MSFKTKQKNALLAPGQFKSDVTTINSNTIKEKEKSPSKNTINSGVFSPEVKKKIEIKNENNNELLLLNSFKFNNIKKRKDFNGNEILKKGKAHHVTFIDQIKRGKLAEITNIQKVNLDESYDDKNQMKRTFHIPNPNKPVGDNCSCTCTIF